MSSTLFRLLFSLLSFFLFSSSPCYPQSEAAGVIHIHSHISHNEALPLRKTVELAKERGVHILIFTDSLLKSWEYGSPLFSHIFKIAIERGSVIKYGIKHYLDDIKKLREEFPDMFILEGIEVTPHYWWSGSPFKKNLTLNDGNKQLLVVGLKKYRDYEHLPVVSNRYFIPQLKDIPSLLVSVLLILFGIVLVRKRKKFSGFALNLIGILFFLNSFPFSASRYSPYRADRKFLAQQNFINYVNKKGGLVFWSLPETIESTSCGKFSGVSFCTSSYPEALVLTFGYTGFGINLTSGQDYSLIRAGGEWDKVLVGYCKGRRNKPVWVIGEADYSGQGNIDSLQNIFLLKEFSLNSVYEALRKGRLYVRAYSENSLEISLSDFYIEDTQNIDTAKRAFIAEEIEIKGNPKIYIKGNYITNSSEPLKLEIVRNGKVVKNVEFSSVGEFDLEFQDDTLPEKPEKIYYRLNFLAGNAIILVTNPVFVKMRNG